MCCFFALPKCVQKLTITSYLVLVFCRFYWAYKSLLKCTPYKVSLWRLWLKEHLLSDHWQLTYFLLLFESLYKWKFSLLLFLKKQSNLSALFWFIFILSQLSITPIFLISLIIMSDWCLLSLWFISAVLFRLIREIIRTSLLIFLWTITIVKDILFC